MALVQSFRKCLIVRDFRRGAGPNPLTVNDLGSSEARKSTDE